MLTLNVQVKQRRPLAQGLFEDKTEMENVQRRAECEPGL